MVIIRKENYNYFQLHKIKQRISKKIYDYKTTVDNYSYCSTQHRNVQIFEIYNYIYIKKQMKFNFTEIIYLIQYIVAYFFIKFKFYNKTVHMLKYICVAGKLLLF